MTDGELDGHYGRISEVRRTGQFTVEERELEEGAAIEEIVQPEGEKGNTCITRDGSEAPTRSQETTSEDGVSRHGVGIEACGGETAGDARGEGFKRREGRRTGGKRDGISVGDGASGNVDDAQYHDSVALFLDGTRGDVVGGDESAEVDGAFGGGAFHTDAMLPGDES